MADFTATVNNVVDVAEGKRVTVTAFSPEVIPDQLSQRTMEARARARAAIGAGFAKEGFIRNLDFRLSTPRLERRTEVISSDVVGPDAVRYEIMVKSGPLLR